MMEDTGTGRGFRITHEDDQGKAHNVFVGYNETGKHCLYLEIDGHSVYLDSGKSGFFLAHCSTWYDWDDESYEW